jgi:hypothetical protein
LIRFQESQDQPADRGFPASALSDETQGLALIDGKINAVHGLDPADDLLQETPAHGKMFLETFNFEHNSHQEVSKVSKVS